MVFLTESNNMEDNEIEQLKRQLDSLKLIQDEKDQLVAERDSALTEVETMKKLVGDWESRYQEEVQRSISTAQKVVNDWRASPAPLEENKKYISDHGDLFFLGGWRMSVEHTLSKYPDLDPMQLMDPQERARHDRRLKKAVSMGITLEELDPKDDVSDFGPSDDSGEDGEDAGLDESGDHPGTWRAIIAQPEALAAELPFSYDTEVPLGFALSFDFSLLSALWMICKDFIFGTMGCPMDMFMFLTDECMTFFISYSFVIV